MTVRDWSGDASTHINCHDPENPHTLDAGCWCSPVRYRVTSGVVYVHTGTVRPAVTAAIEADIRGAALATPSISGVGGRRHAYDEAPLSLSVTRVRRRVGGSPSAYGGN